MSEVSSELNHLLVQATAELLADWYGPLVWKIDARQKSYRCSCMLVGLDADKTRARVAGSVTGRSKLPELWLDLARAECRARVLACIADKAVSPRGATSGSHQGVCWTRQGAPGRSWILYGDGDLRFCLPEEAGDDGIAVPGFAEIDPEATFRLLDGSQYIDALAIRFAWEHVSSELPIETCRLEGA